MNVLEKANAKKEFVSVIVDGLALIVRLELAKMLVQAMVLVILELLLVNVLLAS
jgi:hypothetical protein